MAQAKFIGQIYKVDPATQTPGGKTVRRFVLYIRNERDELWSDYLPIEVLGDRCSLLDQFALGTTVEVSVDIRGRRYQDKTTGEEKYFASVNAYNIATPSRPQQQFTPASQYQNPVIPGAQAQTVQYSQVLPPQQTQMQFAQQPQAPQQTQKPATDLPF